MANWTMQDRVTHNGVTRTIGEWLGDGVMQLEQHFEGRSYRYYATLGDRMFQINKAAYLSRTGQSMQRLSDTPIVDGVKITGKSIKDYNARRFPPSANDKYNESYGYITNAQWNILSTVDRHYSCGYCDHEVTMDQVRRYAEREEASQEVVNA